MQAGTFFSEGEKNVALSCSFNFNTFLASFHAASRAHHPCARRCGAAGYRGWRSKQPAVLSACGCQTQADPDGDRDEPGRSSNLTGPGIRAEGAGLNLSLCNEMRTVNKHCWWRHREVRVLRQQELLFFPESLATSEDIDPGRQRRSCKLTVEDFQDVELRWCN